MTTPTDPLYASQWHFALLGDIETIWNEYTGSGVHVGVYDEGVDITHEDLAANYDASRHVLDGTSTPIVGNATGPHGTAVAGLIGADNNGVGGVGVAFDSSITGVNIFDAARYGYVNAVDIAPFLDVVGQAGTRFDISSNSWGATPGFGVSQSLNSGGFADQLDGVYDALSTTGRGGLGTIITQASGNDNRDANGDGVNASRFTISVAATEQTGIAASYSNFGASILIAAPAAGVTTDLTGVPGYDDGTSGIPGFDTGNYTSGFNGTSAATPVVSGVIALMLDANPDLGWRDVQNILAHSASLTGSAFNAVAPNATEEGLWQANHSGNWNGGGNHIHTNYGYGMVNAYNATRMAEVWHLFETALTSANESSSINSLNFDDVVVPDNNATGITTTFTISSDLDVEHVQLSLDLQTTFIGDLRIILTSAEGTVITLARGNVNIGTDVNGVWSWGVDQLRGELSAGTWTVQVADIAAADLTTLRSAQLDFFGTTNDNHDVYHFTDEYLTMLGFDAARATVSDSNGGIDWLNLAAVRGGINLNMVSGSTFTVGGVNWATLSGDFENVVVGDGNDTVAGNTLGNVIYGMRGNDRMTGLGGADTLNGGTGNDTLYGGFGIDSMTGGVGSDLYDVYDAGDVIVEAAGGGTDTVYFAVSYTLAANVEHMSALGTGNINGTGNGLANIMHGNTGNNALNGLVGNDTLNGGNGNDTLYGGADADSMTGGAGDDKYDINHVGDVIVEASGVGSGIDQVYFSINYTLAANVENMAAVGAANINGTGNTLNNYISGNTGNNALNGLDGADTLNGGNGNDTLYGGADADSMTGGAGDDKYDINHVGDVIVETAGVGSGIDQVFFSINYTLAANVENMAAVGAANINGTGNTLNNYISGNTGNNFLSGLDGADTLNGGNGNDTLYGGTGVDSMTGGAGDDKYDIHNVGDVIVETAGVGSGIDQVYFSISYTLAANVEHMAALGSADINGTGNGLTNFISGNSGKNMLDGQGGNDTLIGGAGSDTLTGGTGADTFVFDAALGASNVDSVTDYSVAADTIRLDNAIFSSLALGGLAASAFAANLSGQATDLLDRIIYETDTGNLFYDQDGLGGVAGVLFAVLSPGLATMGNGEFLIV